MVCLRAEDIRKCGLRYEPWSLRSHSGEVIRVDAAHTPYVLSFMDDVCGQDTPFAGF